MTWILVQDVEEAVVTLAWEAVPGAERYEVQIQPEGGDWVTLSDSLKSTMVRKKNLASGTKHLARARAYINSDWGSFGDTCEFETLSSGVARMDAPALVLADGEGITMSYEAAEGAAEYEVQFRSETDSEWKVASTSLKGTALRKKNLEPGRIHFFRVRPGGGSGAFSPPSQPVVLASLSPFLSNVLGGGESKLINNAGKEAPVKSLAGQVVALYCSASWCGPCRQFTPQLVMFYVKMKQAKHPFEVVFVSCDRDPASFNKYREHMPWWAMDYHSDSREEALGKLKVQGIPHLVILDRNGAVIEDKVQGHQLTEASMMRWMQGLKSA